MPLWFNMPTVPSFSAGGADQSLQGTTSLAAGTYGMLTVKPNAVVTLTGGTYDFTSVEVKPGAHVRASAPVTIRVTGRVLLAGSVEFGPTANSFIHLWAYPSMQERNAIREKTVQAGIWPPAGGREHYLAMENKFLMPSSFSPAQ